MNKILVFLCAIIFTSCHGQSRVNPVEKFENELTKIALARFRENSPLPISESLLASSSFYASFEALGNSGTNLLYDLEEKNYQVLNPKLKTYAKLENNKLESFNYNFRYSYKNKSILLPSVSDEWNDVLGEVDLKSNEIEIYLIQEGKLENFFKQDASNSAKHNFSCGVYYFKKTNKLIYWFTIYNQ